VKLLNTSPILSITS